MFDDRKTVLESCAKLRVTADCVGVCSIPKECVDNTIKFALELRAQAIRKFVARLMNWVKFR